MTGTATFPGFADSHRVYAPDLIGFGQSERRRETYTVRRFSDSLYDFMDAVGVRQAVMLGHSLGGRACLEVAYRAPQRVSRLVLVAPIGFGRLSVLGMVLGAAAWAAYQAVRRPLPYPNLDVRLDDPDVDKFRRVASPTLIVWGRRDLYFPSKYADRVRNLIPDSRSFLLSSSGACPAQE